MKKAEELKELRSLTFSELEDKVLSVLTDLYKLRFKKANGSLDKSHFFSKARKTIARAKTIMTEIKAG